MQVRPAALDDVPELIRLRAVALDSLGTGPGPADAPWRVAADGRSRVHLVQLHASADGESVCRAAGFTAARYPGMDLVIGPDA
ncbi:hypothetical protein ACFWBI_09275 [Streptomyces sp. NPDC059982]|uniref:hypothetical protein n=1 Tax=unclassified Streptomyces TaxID=2593676 RepID=UPI0036A5BC08